MKNIITITAAISFVVAISLISAIAYAQQENQTMDKPYKYYAIQNTVTSVPDKCITGSYTISSDCF